MELEDLKFDMAELNQILNTVVRQEVREVILTEINILSSKITSLNKLIDKQDRQYAYNVTFGAFMQPLLQWKRISIIYSECMLVALSIQYALCMRHIVICGLPSSTIFFHIIS